MKVVPITHKAAKAFVRRLHRHNRHTTGAILCAAVAVDGVVVGVAIAGRPVARALDDGSTLEITRVCTDGTRNACSMLYGACRRAGKALGYAPIITYTLPEEGGASLRAAGFEQDGKAGRPSRHWGSRPGRACVAIGDDLVGGKIRWIA